MNEDEVTMIICALVRYLRANPLACDSASGIARWWLQPEIHVSMEALMHALEWLKQRGIVEQSAGTDGRTRYRRRGNDEALDAAVAERDAAVRRRTC